MPFKSEAQKRWMYANKPEMAKQWQKDTPKGASLPARKAPKAKRTKKSSMPPGGYHQ